MLWNRMVILVEWQRNTIGKNLKSITFVKDKYFELKESQKFLRKLFSLVKSFPKVYASPRSVQNKHPLDASHPFKNTLPSVENLRDFVPKTLQAFWKKLDQKLYLLHTQQILNFFFLYNIFYAVILTSYNYRWIFLFFYGKIIF